MLLGLTMWLAWTVRPTVNPDHRLADTPQETGPIANMSYEYLMSIASRLAPESDRAASSGHVHQLIRFNVCNFGPQSVTLRAVAVNTTGGDTLSCELVPPPVVQPGARYPLCLSVTVGPVLPERAEIEAEDVAGRRQWLSPRLLPNP
jgi:hypothetical protein